jgi:hypothetical protein
MLHPHFLLPVEAGLRCLADVEFWLPEQPESTSSRANERLNIIERMPVLEFIFLNRIISTFL